MKRSLLLALPLLLAAAPAAAFKRSTTEDGGDVCLYWPRRNITWHAASPLGAAAGESAALTALRASFAAWDGISCTDLAFHEGSRSGRQVGYERGASNASVVLFRTDGSCRRYAGEPCSRTETCPDEHDCWDYPDDLLAVTTTFFDTCGQLLDADIEFNGGAFAFTASDGPPCTGGSTTNCVAFDIGNTATHEIGHLLGLDHPDPAGDPSIQEATMYASAGNGETKKRSLEQDDVSGICTVYPAGDPPVSCRPAQECSSPQRAGTSCCAATPGEASLLAGLVSVVILGRRRRRP